MVVAAPLTSCTLTSGVLGFVECRGRRWQAEAKNTLKTVAAMFAQARISAEERLRRATVEHYLPTLRIGYFEGDQRFARRRRRRLVHPRIRRAPELVRRRPGPGCPAGWRRVPRRSRPADDATGREAPLLHYLPEADLWTGGIVPPRRWCAGVTRIAMCCYPIRSSAWPSPWTSPATCRLYHSNPLLGVFDLG
jgi:hypothetical protein